MEPSVEPSGQPSFSPTTQPSNVPSNSPSSQPSSLPSREPSLQPSFLPSTLPSQQSSSPSSDLKFSVAFGIALPSSGLMNSAEITSFENKRLAAATGCNDTNGWETIDSVTVSSQTISLDGSYVIIEFVTTGSVAQAISSQSGADQDKLIKCLKTNYSQLENGIDTVNDVVEADQGSKSKQGQHLLPVIILSAFAGCLLIMSAYFGVLLRRRREPVSIRSTGSDIEDAASYTMNIAEESAFVSHSPMALLQTVSRDDTVSTRSCI